MLYELRIYYIYPGKMEAIHQRFANHTIKLFKKYNLKVTDFWEDAEGKNVIYYMIEHKDMASRNANFEAFRNDEDWLEVKRESELEGPIVEKLESIYMNRVPYSPKK